ncbi:hypothetical protein SS1G_00163 [Sclerotinia sclerotiorum 1980 UF-70]|uniref:Uncharacterized protein n=1 Tax=Sclerotinia sclerotiorum (strain ATCC 18683 / 1980 / Ss-1) TaxID=665079 RepID=A7E4E1_SCLS1|nr:hypothetical protein SS1G_00163 [Sclerotinia sclerotiorum 1980 UF-70]EDN90763.1 hypothetical protein SS1G_00163 [Sclerotinia sclerotiorum 1980 UF-70]
MHRDKFTKPTPQSNCKLNFETETETKGFPFSRMLPEYLVTYSLTYLVGINQ